MKRIYIAGPMRGYPDFNFPAFFAGEARLSGLDVLVFNPARRDVEQHGDGFAVGTTGKLEEIPEFSLREALGYDLDWICKHATEVHLLKGWSASKGAAAERATALALGIDVTYEDPYETESQAEEDASARGYDDGWSDGWQEGYDQRDQEGGDV